VKTLMPIPIFLAITTGEAYRGDARVGKMGKGVESREAKTGKKNYHGREIIGQRHRRIARGGHEVPKVSLGPALPKPSSPCGQATPETALWPYQGWLVRRASVLRPSSTPLDTPHRTPPASAKLRGGVGRGQEKGETVAANVDNKQELNEARTEDDA
jgi:hypothetical protein